MIDLNQDRHGVNVMAGILLILQEKGVCTQDEIENAIVRGTAGVDQAMAERREKALAAMTENQRKGLRFLDKILKTGEYE